MGRIKPAWYYERMAQKRKSREDYFRNRQPTTNTTVDSRNNTTLYYRSLFNKVGGDHVIYQVRVYDETLAQVSTAEAGLLTQAEFDNLTNTPPAFRLRGSGLTPTKIRWHKGRANPVGKNTSWGTRYIKYYDETGGHSHFSTPFSQPSGNFTASDIRGKFNTVFTAAKLRAVVGENNGRVELDLEDIVTAKDT